MPEVKLYPDRVIIRDWEKERGREEETERWREEVRSRKDER